MKKHTMSMPGHDISAKERTVDVITTENSSFKDLLLSYNVLSGLQKARFERPSPIQLKAIPYGRCGLDLIVQAKSGTGKTCVFTVIALEAISTEAPTLQVIILAPTREIAVQIEDVVKAVGQDIRGLKVGAFIGGRPLSEDKINAKGCHIAVGSPGRIFQLIELEVLKCQSVRIFILDEADKLLEDNFQSQINSIYSMLPENKQMIAASATYPDELAQFVTRYMRDPTFIRLNPKDMALLGVKQYYYLIDDPPDKFYSVFECKIKAVVELLKLYPFQQTLIFSNYHSHAKDLSDACNSAGLPSTYISGNLEQERRLEAMKMLKDFKCRVLISTDLTARGIDASNVDLVVNLDVPYDWETYMHRTGRAGRFGSHGYVVSIVTSGTEIDELLEIAKTCAVTLLPMRVESGQINIGSSPGIFNDYSAQKSPDSREMNSSSEKDVTVGKTQNIPKIAKAESIGTGRNPIEAPEQSVDRDFPKIPSLPELMNKYSKSTGYKYSYKYSDVLENFKYFMEHGIFKEFKKREPPVEQIKSRSEQSMGFVNQESLADDLQSKLHIKDKPSTSDFSETMTIQSSKTSSVKNFKQNPSVIESIANDSNKFHKDDPKSTKTYDVHDMRQEMDKKSSVTNTKSVKAQKHCEGDYKGDVSDNVHDMFTNPKAKKSRKKHRSKKKQKGSREGQDSDGFEDEEVPPFLLPRFSDNTEPDYLRNMTYSHQQMQAQMQYNMYWYNYYYYWQHWHNAQAMGNFGNPWHG